MKPSNGRQQRSEKTKEKIIASAMKLFFAHGYSDVSTDMIAKEAGISKGGIFPHFSTKEELELLALKTTLDEFRYMLQNIEQVEDLGEVMKMVVSQTLVFGQENHGFMKMLMWYFLKLDEEIDNKRFYSLMKATFLDTLLPYAQALESLFVRLGQDQSRIKSLLLMDLLDDITIYITCVNRLFKYEPELATYFDDFNDITDIIMELFFQRRNKLR